MKIEDFEKLTWSAKRALIVKQRAEEIEAEVEKETKMIKEKEEKLDKQISELANELFLRENLEFVNKALKQCIDSINEIETIIHAKTSEIFRIKNQMRVDMERKKGYEEQLRAIGG